MGAAAGATTILRPLIVAELVGTAPYAAVSACLPRATALARAGAPFALGAGAATMGWTSAWLVSLGAFALAAWCYHRIGQGHPTSGMFARRNTRPGEALDV